MSQESTPTLMTSGAELYEYNRRLSESNVVLSLRGAMSQETLVELGDLIRLLDAAPEGTRNSHVKKLFAIMVEMAQNILFYSSERQYLPYLEREVGVGLIMLQQTDSSFVISCGNQMTRESQAAVEERCRYINQLDREALREYYNTERRRIRQEEQAGAGLGLIDIARRAGHPLQFSFYDVDDGHTYFSLSVQVDKVTPQPQS